jgi:hypothetical protein
MLVITPYRNFCNHTDAIEEEKQADPKKRISGQDRR